MKSPRFLLPVGVILLLLGWVLPLVMVLKVIPSSFSLTFSVGCISGWTLYWDDWFGDVSKIEKVKSSVITSVNIVDE